MSSNSIPYFAAEAFTAAIVSRGSSAADKTDRAKTASQVAAFFSAISAGDATGANAQVSAFISGVKDPGLQKVAADLWSAGQPYLQVELNVAENVPVLGGSVSQALADVGAGMAAAAGAYLTTGAK